VTTCSECRELLESTTGVPESREAYAQVLDRVFDTLVEENRAIEAQRSGAPALLAELLALSPNQRKLRVHNSSRYHAWPLAEELLAQSRRGWTEDPERSEELASLALEITSHLECAGFRRYLLDDLRAEAWSYIGNCRRIRFDYLEAEKAFQAAERFLAQGSGDRMERARLLDLEASLYASCRDYRSAASLLDEAIAEYRGAGDSHLEGRALIKQAKLLHDSGGVEDAIAVLERAGELIDVAREPGLVFALKTNLIAHLVEAGRPEEAQRLLPEAREIAREHANRLERLRFLWTEGLLCAALGRVELAEEALEQVRGGFLAAGIGSDVALVSLNLATLYLEAGRTHEVRKLAAESASLFASRGIHREVVMAWSLFREAAERDTVTLGLVQEVASRIRHAQGRPGGPAGAS
jgi:tetratricopeptide (TPR) repeat protein